MPGSSIGPTRTYLKNAERAMTWEWQRPHGVVRLPTRLRRGLGEGEVDGDVHPNRYRLTVHHRGRIPPIPDRLECRIVQQRDRLHNLRVRDAARLVNQYFHDDGALDPSRLGVGRVLRDVES